MMLLENHFLNTTINCTLLVEEKNIQYCHLSISDEKNIAVAFVILEAIMKK